MTGEYTTNETVGGYKYQIKKRNGQYVTILETQQGLRHINLCEYGKNEVVFGRKTGDYELDLALKSPIVSHEHGVFKLEKGNWYIEDKESTNGILCNGAYIKKRLLSEGDIYRIGKKREERGNSVLFLISSDSMQGTWKPYIIGKDTVTIGRDASNDVVLSDITVSRFHATIQKTGEGWVIRTEGSKNGVLVNDNFIDDLSPIIEQDVITITNTKIIFTAQALYICSYSAGVSVDVRNVVVERGKGEQSFITVDHVSMTISPGEIVAIIGGSGAGKSTIMNVMCGYLKPNEGSVYINGNDLYRNFDALRSTFGYVPQSDIVYNDLTLHEMLRYSADLRLPRDISETERERTIEQAIAMVELNDKTDSLIKNLSGGQRKRASIAVELLSDPKLLFLDEPVSGLDPGTERSLMLSLKRMAMTGRTIVLVTHSTLHLSICDKIAFLGKGGRLCFFGDEQDAFDFFQTNDIIDVYSEISDHAVEWNEKYRNVSIMPEEVKSENGITNSHEQRRSFQLAVLCKRYARLIMNDRQRFLLLVLQAPLLSFLISLVADGEQFKQYEMTKGLLFALSCSAFWIGMLNAIQEICKEHTVLKREYMAGLSLTSYIVSKIVILGLLCMIQCILLIGAFGLLVGVPAQGMFLPPLIELFITAWLTALSAVAMGLFVSSLFTNPDRAMTVAPLLLLPQILFSGLLFTLSDVTEYISYLAICRWSMESMGTISNLNKLPLIVQQQGLPIVHEAEHFFERTEGHFWSAWVILAAFTLLFLLFARLSLIKIRTSEN